MSAWLPHPEHIVLIANFAANDRESRFRDPKLNGTVLAREVIRSVTHRYPDIVGEGFKNAPGPLNLTTEQQYIADSSKHIDLDCLDISLADMAALVACYEYQACETNNWAHSPASTICKGVDYIILSRLRDQASKRCEWGLETNDLELREVIALSRINQVGFDKGDLKKLSRFHPSHPESQYLESLITETEQAA